MQSSTHSFFYDICLLLLVFLPVEFADILLFKKKVCVNFFRFDGCRRSGVTENTSHKNLVPNVTYIEKKRIFGTDDFSRRYAEAPLRLANCRIY